MFFSLDKKFHAHYYPQLILIFNNMFLCCFTFLRWHVDGISLLLGNWWPRCKWFNSNFHCRGADAFCITLYYIFGIAYNEEVCATMDIMQRYLLSCFSYFFSHPLTTFYFCFFLDLPPFVPFSFLQLTESTLHEVVTMIWLE